MAGMEVEQIMRILPHRYPMLLVDRVLERDEKRIVGLKNVSVNEPFFCGHYPGTPVMPGVLQLEAMAQTAGLLILPMTSSEGIVPYFMGIDKARFRRVVKPGDQLRIEVEIVAQHGRTYKFKGQILVDGAVASEAELLCMATQQKAGTE